MIVADTNLIAYLLIDGEFTSVARACAKRDDDWVAPAIWRHEFVNIPALNVRKQNFDAAKALQLLALADELVGSPPRWPSIEDVIALASAAGIATYDAEFVVAARAAGVRVVTNDRGLIKLAPETDVSIHDFAAGR